MNALEDLRAAMKSAGLNFAGQFQVDDQFQRFDCAGEKGEASYYSAHNYGEVLVATFGCFRRGIQQTWCSRSRGEMTGQQWGEVSRAWKEQARQREEEEKKKNAQARERCGKWFGSVFPRAAEHAYLTLKGVPASGPLYLCTEDRHLNWLALPLQDHLGVIHTAEFIAEDGTKDYLWGGRKKGCYFPVSDVPGGPILICEGYATGASLFQATGWTVICAMDCGNLLPAGQEIRKRHPNRTVIIAADNDQFSEDNPGMTKAAIAAKSIHGVVAHPEFGDESLAEKPTDFNDLHRIEGLVEVRRQIYSAMTVVARPIGDFKTPEKDDPTELLKYRYLCDHGSLLFNGPAGMGKSSALVQAAGLWANGLDFFDVIPRKPLKTLIIQAENDDGDIAQMRDGISTGLKFTREQRLCFFENVLVYPSWGVTGRAFCQEVVRPLLDLHDPNLVAIDPALSFLGGDVKEQKVVGQFLREYLNPVIFEHTCACIVMHHTNKPLTGKEKGSWRNGELAYTGSGSAEWANWPRAVIALQSTGNPGYYNLHASKRGARLGWTNSDDELIYQKMIAWSRDKNVIFWREPDPGELPEQEETRDSGHGRPSAVSRISTMNSHEFLAACPVQGESRKPLARRLESWLATKHIDVSFETCRRAILALVENQKLSKDPDAGLYFKGPNA
jgi:phage/plasmid primase-like uncharacterized protein